LSHKVRPPRVVPQGVPPSGFPQVWSTKGCPTIVPIWGHRGVPQGGYLKGGPTRGVTQVGSHNGGPIRGVPEVRSIKGRSPKWGPTRWVPKL
jgi:hypothetical protein